MTETTTTHEAVVLFSGPECWESEARALLDPLGVVVASPYCMAYGETTLVLHARISNGAPGRANTSTLLADLPGWRCRSYAPEADLATYRRGVQ
jgi:hypothetical protein